MPPKSVGAYAIRRSEGDLLLADSEDTLNKVIALKWVAEWVPPRKDLADVVRSALLEERWGEAVIVWMDATGEVIDVFPSFLEIHEAHDYPDEEFGLRIQTSPLFRQ